MPNTEPKSITYLMLRIDDNLKDVDKFINIINDQNPGITIVGERNVDPTLDEYNGPPVIYFP